MTKLEYFLSIFFLTILLNSCNSQKADKINLSKIILHSSRCNGDCPKIDLIIDSSKEVYVIRKYFKEKNEIQTPYSGLFKGKLLEKDYNKLLGLLQTSNLDTLKFPDITCCDGIITTIILYYNGQRKYFKSMNPPNEAKALIDFLLSIGNNKDLRITTEIKNIEE